MSGGGKIFLGLAATDSRTALILAWDMVTAELPLCVLCTVQWTRYPVLSKCCTNITINLPFQIIRKWQMFKTVTLF